MLLGPNFGSIQELQVAFSGCREPQIQPRGELGDVVSHLRGAAGRVGRGLWEGVFNLRGTLSGTLSGEFRLNS